MNITESPVDMEGTYCFISNNSVDATSIAEVGFNVTATQAEQYKTSLALEDTTSLSYSLKSIRNELGHVNQPELWIIKVIVSVACLRIASYFLHQNKKK